MANLEDGASHPPQHVIDFSVEQSTFSPCRSKRGVVLFVGDDIVGHGYNFKPRGFDCDGSDACKATCRTEAVHAEQFALLCANQSRARGADLVHVKSVDGKLVPSGGPSCVQCSKLILACGVKGVWLYRADGWRRYEAREFHRLSLEAKVGASPAARIAAIRQAEEWLLCAEHHLRPGWESQPAVPIQLVRDLLALLVVGSDQSRFCEAHQIPAENETCPCCEAVHLADELERRKSHG